MAAFCHFWHIAPSEYKTMRLDEVRAFTEYANEDIGRRNREAKASRRRR